MKIGDTVRVNHDHYAGVGRYEDWIIRKIEGDTITVAIKARPVVKQGLPYWKLVDMDGNPLKKPPRPSGWQMRATGDR